jgi:hypothetical protein
MTIAQFALNTEKTMINLLFSYYLLEIKVSLLPAACNFV